MSSGPRDSSARRRALDAHRSFIVQAPAGSGKTELLIQRYLTLLRDVEQPEQIVAITFTRKAAAEMRARIVNALRDAANGESAAEPHRALTLELAVAVLERDSALGWSLLAQPRRMRIDTLDALNAWLALQLPILAGGAAGARIVEDASALYGLAARRTLDELGATGTLGDALRSLLPLLGNSQVRLESLLVDLLPKRDQWLRHLASSNDTDLRRDLERALEQAIEDELDRVEGLCPSGLGPRLEPLLHHAARHSDDETIKAASRACLEPPPSGTAGRLVKWRGIAHLLLTGTGTWRLAVTRKQGFAPEHPDEKKEFLGVLDSLRDEAELRDALAVVPKLPDPGYSPTQWRNLEALSRVLTHLVVELRVIFADRETVDFIELALSAQRALGQVDEPSELLLALDHRIHHLLIDEFQDTSRTQLRLIELLTAGWQRGDGRTLFLVGDPMQSIYRFRDADMSLFLEATRHGIGHVDCEPLILESNFRSAPAIVDWINRAFASVFPAEDDIASGAAKFHPSAATRESTEDQAVELHSLRSDDGQAELERVVEVLESERARCANQSIGILVQSRTHLSGLLERLAAKGWPVRAIEIDSVAEVQVGQDLIGLTRALSHLGDRIAWLGVLRAPWCGLGWRDLDALCGDAPDRTIWDLLNDPDRIESLSPDGQQRLLAVHDVLGTALGSRGDRPFARWVEHTWMELDGPSCLEQREDFNTVDQFFGLLDAATETGDIEDPALIESVFSRPLAQADPPDQAGIEIMTVHRAKGLEFDTVVLFGLARETRREKTRALYWMERTATDGAGALIMAPMSRDPDRLTAFVRQVEDRKQLAERARLLYVATTRARDRLHLVLRLRPNEANPRPRTLLACVWPELSADFRAADIHPPDRAAEASTVRPMLRRFADGFGSAKSGRSSRLHALIASLRRVDPDISRVFAPRDPDTRGIDSEARFRRPQYQWAGQSAVQTGIVVHRHLRRIADTGLGAWDSGAIDGLTSQFRLELAQLGVESSELVAAAANVAAALSRIIEDPDGRWILSAHCEASSELRLTIRGATRLEHLQLDRTFIDGKTGVRWIIDYKTSAHEGSDIDSFLDSEVTRYRAQLDRYASAMAEIDSRPIRVGLYFPLLGAFRHWQPNT